MFLLIKTVVKLFKPVIYSNLIFDMTGLTRGSFRVKEVNRHENSVRVMTQNDRFVSMARHDTKLPVRSVSSY